MRLSAAFFALGLGLGLPSLAIALGASLPDSRYFALGMVGFCAGIALPAALDLLARVWPSEAASVIRQREANTAATEVATAERWHALSAVEVAEPAADDPSAEDEWYTHTLRPFFTNAQRAGGFSHSLLGRTMVEDDWTNLCRFYSSPVGRNVLRLEGGNVGYVLNTPTWTHAAVLREIVNHTLPHPEGLAYDVETLTDDTTRRSARRAEMAG